MICIDASVYVARTRTVEVNYAVSQRFIKEVERRGIEVCAPMLVLPECASALARPTGDTAEGNRLARFVQRFIGERLIPLTLPAAIRTAEVAAECRLRGADACYVATAEAMRATLITWDAEMRERGAAAVPTATPEEWLEQQQAE